MKKILPYIVAGAIMIGSFSLFDKQTQIYIDVTPEISKVIFDNSPGEIKEFVDNDGIPGIDYMNFIIGKDTTRFSKDYLEKNFGDSFRRVNDIFKEVIREAKLKKLDDIRLYEFYYWQRYNKVF